MNHLVYWVWLSLRCGAGSELASYLLSKFETPKAVYDASEKTLLATEGIDRRIADALLDRDLSYAAKVITYCERQNIGIMTLESEIYPERLRAIHGKPPVLYYRGRFPDMDDNVCIACVGTRKCSVRGEENAYRLGHDLAAAGAIVVSGMALGIDGAANRGALDAGGHTIAVLGCGIDRVYPSQHEELMARIAEHGTVITEFAPGTEPSGKHFPIRNRIISGLCQGTVVVEADAGSGALITARHAEMQGRDVFAFPGTAGEALSGGTNALIKNGASLVTSAMDILSEYELLYPHRISTERILSSSKREKTLRVASSAKQESERRSEQSEVSARPLKKKLTKEEIASAEPVREKKRVDLSGLSPEEALIVESMDAPISAEELARVLSQKAGKPYTVGELLGMLTMLEIGGYIEALPGGSFQLASES